MYSRIITIIIFTIISQPSAVKAQDIYAEMAAKNSIYEANKNLLFDIPTKKPIYNQIGQINITCNKSGDLKKHGTSGPVSILAGIIVGIPLDLLFLPFGAFGEFSSPFFRDYLSSREVNVTFDVGNNKIILRDKNGRDLIQRGELKKNSRRYIEKFVKNVCSKSELSEFLNNPFMSNVDDYLVGNDVRNKTILYYDHYINTRRTSVTEKDIDLYNSIIEIYSDISKSDNTLSSIEDFLSKYNYEVYSVLPSKFTEYMSYNPETYSFTEFEYFTRGELAIESSLYKNLSDVEILYELKNESIIISYNKELYKVTEGSVSNKYFSNINILISQSEIDTYLAQYENKMINKYVSHLVSQYESTWKQERWENPNFAPNTLFLNCRAAGESFGFCLNYAEQNQSRILVSYPTKYLIPENKWYEISYDWENEDIFLTDRGFLRDYLIYDFSSKSLKVSSIDNSSLTLESGLTNGLGRLDAIVQQSGRSLNSSEAHYLKNNEVVILAKEKFNW